ncbi:hypothetical protein Mp_1g21140 [Marchantia polymorpha subsp. ruderalis]|uniref:Uncharacterized protein n=2 Tax=Marchantia polymorpha TaxID=3197 RepID=A0AAF6ASJ4_MARPO|nr:hypothetical protein MARPO_0001s0448 [Marchantia polymorpha]BBM99414.1 hypothetical protein Mp_1g21140 [Marchantia polymorpha subsp. ruderalis]|eukprot:PTQ50495.1 hypothetical protein MARPO_0001s0448 [Marchantia polymorpha]
MESKLFEAGKTRNTRKRGETHGTTSAQAQSEQGVGEGLTKIVPTVPRQRGAHRREDTVGENGQGEETPGTKTPGNRSLGSHTSAKYLRSRLADKYKELVGSWMERSDGTGREKAAYARSICYRRRRRIADRTGSRRPGSGRVSSPMHPRDEPADGHRSVASHRPSVRSLALRCRRRELPPRCRRTRRPTRRQEGLFVPPLVGLPSGCPGLPCPALALPGLAWPHSLRPPSRSFVGFCLLAFPSSQASNLAIDPDAPFFPFLHLLSLTSRIPLCCCRALCFHAGLALRGKERRRDGKRGIRRRARRSATWRNSREGHSFD